MGKQHVSLPRLVFCTYVLDSAFLILSSTYLFVYPCIYPPIYLSATPLSSHQIAKTACEPSLAAVLLGQPQLDALGRATAACYLPYVQTIPCICVCLCGYMHMHTHITYWVYIHVCSLVAFIDTCRGITAPEYVCVCAGHIHFSIGFLIGGFRNVLFSCLVAYTGHIYRTCKDSG